MHFKTLCAAVAALAVTGCSQQKSVERNYTGIPSTTFTILTTDYKKLEFKLGNEKKLFCRYEGKSDLTKEVADRIEFASRCQEPPIIDR